HRELVAVELPREIRADRLPRVAAVVAAEQAVRREIDPPRVVRRDDQRAVPVPPQRRLAGPGLRLDLHPLAGPPVEPAQPAVLVLGVHDVRVGRVYLAVEPVTALR